MTMVESCAALTGIDWKQRLFHNLQKDVKMRGRHKHKESNVRTATALSGSTGLSNDGLSLLRFHNSQES